MSGPERPLWAKNLSALEYEFTSRDMFTTTAAAAYLGVSRPWILQQIRSGRLPARKVGRHLRIRRDDLERLRDPSTP